MLDFLVGNDFLSSLIAFGIVLIPAVIIHELGHFLAAKAVGITVLEFGIGFPPRLVKLFRWGETEFTLNWIPLGGFVRPFGEDMIRPLTDEEVERERQQIAASSQWVAQANRPAEGFSERDELAARGVPDPTAVNEVKPLPRIFFMAAGALANFVSAVLLFIAAGLIGIDQVVGTQLTLVSIQAGSPLTQLGLQENDAIELINGQPFAHTADFYARLTLLEGQRVTLGIQRETDQFEVEALLDDSLIAAFGQPEDYVLVGVISEDSPAESAGLRPGDLILRVDGEELTEADDPISALQTIATDQAGETIELLLLRNGEEVSAELIPRENPPPGDGRIGIGIGIGYAAGDIVFGEGNNVMTRTMPLGEAVSFGLDRTGEVFGLIAEFLRRLLEGSVTAEEGRVVSAVGVSQLGGEILQDSITRDRPAALLDFIALISIALGITNLLPIPALDGGRILFVIVEMVRGRPIPPEREGIIHLIGLVVLLSLGMIFIINDLRNPLTDYLP
jgi:regulator of sigma E protease